MSKKIKLNKLLFCMLKKKLWENPNPLNAFSAATAIAIDNFYDAYEIQFINTSSDPIIYTATLFTSKIIGYTTNNEPITVGGKVELSSLAGGSGTGTISLLKRVVSEEDAAGAGDAPMPQISFGAALQSTTSAFSTGWTTRTNQDACIPYRIYGLGKPRTNRY